MKTSEENWVFVWACMGVIYASDRLCKVLDVDTMSLTGVGIWLAVMVFFFLGLVLAGRRDRKRSEEKTT